MKSAIESAIQKATSPAFFKKPGKRLGLALHAPFSADPSLASGIGQADATRNCAKYVTDFEGKLFKLNANEFASEGARMTRNIQILPGSALPYSVSVGNTMSVSGGVYTLGGTTGWALFRFGNGVIAPSENLAQAGAIDIRIVSGDPEILMGLNASPYLNITLTPEYKRYTVKRQEDNKNAVILIWAPTNTTIEVRRPQIEDVTGLANQSPSEYAPIDTAMGAELWPDGEVSSLGYGQNTTASIDFLVEGERYVINGLPDGVSIKAGANWLTSEAAFVAEAGLLSLLIQKTEAGDPSPSFTPSVKAATTGLLVSNLTNGNTVNSGIVTEVPGIPLRDTKLVAIGKNKPITRQARFKAPADSEVLALNEHRAKGDRKYTVTTPGALSATASTDAWSTTIGDSVVSGSVTMLVGYHTIKGILGETFSSTNLFLHSENFSDVYWVKYGVTIASNFDFAPGGEKTADKMISPAATSFNGMGKDGNTGVGMASASIHAKSAGIDVIQICFGNSTTVEYANFNLITGKITAGSYLDAIMIPVGDGFFKCSIVFSSAIASATCYFLNQTDDNAPRAANTTGNGVDGTIVWGAQLNQGPLSSYISTTTAPATRVAEAFKYDLSNHKNAAGTVLINWRPSAAKGSFPGALDEGIISLQNSAFSLLETSGSADILNSKDGTNIVSNSLSFIADEEVAIGVTWGAGQMIIAARSSQGSISVIGLYDGAYDLGTAINLLYGMTVGCHILDYVHTQDVVSQAQLESYVEFDI